MATIHRSPALPDNIVEVDDANLAAAHRLYEAGNLLVLRGVRIDADFDFLDRLRVDGEETRRKKFFLTHPDHYDLESDRSSVWREFRRRTFRGWRGLVDYPHFRRQVLTVNAQIATLAARVFPRYRTLARTIAWKFQHVRGENLHIDNIEHCDRLARLRIFVNLGRSERIWAISHHLRHVAHDCFDDAGLARFAGQPYEFNRAVSAFAFGDSRAAAAAPQPRHLLYFEPGEVWCLNSMVTAHQVLYGTRAAVATMPFAYDDYECPAEALPHIVAGLCHAHAT
jgi:hypothetical protein